MFYSFRSIFCKYFDTFKYCHINILLRFLQKNNKKV
nr:MAG TPA: hypothetical protein [Caudoviricetes sp.]